MDTPQPLSLHLELESPVSLLPLLAPLILLPAADKPRFELNKNDCVVFIGSALIEQEQRYGYWEAALTSRFPGKSIRFRNLGWSGDNVFGEAQAGFGTPADGFRHLKDHVLSLNPNVIFVGYGTNESFDGPNGLPRFVAGLNTLLDALAPTKARFVLISPLKQENLGRPLPDPTAANENLKLYADAIRDVAEQRNMLYVDLFNLPGAENAKTAHLTEDQVHPTGFGYRRLASVFMRGLGARDDGWMVERLQDGTTRAERANATVTGRGEEKSVAITSAILPRAPGPGSLDAAKRVLKFEGLEPGAYTLFVDKKSTITATAAQWAAGVPLLKGPDFLQAEKLRTAIVAKNRLYFHRWRPQNETYLFGFRKHEQGQNAREIPLFDPLVAEAENEIAKLAVPTVHAYELRRAESK
jgi:lysophospholipase L1-like esterase